jgi:hypothetical protein
VFSASVKTFGATVQLQDIGRTVTCFRESGRGVVVWNKVKLRAFLTVTVFFVLRKQENCFIA